MTRRLCSRPFGDRLCALFRVLHTAKKNLSGWERSKERRAKILDVLTDRGFGPIGGRDGRKKDDLHDRRQDTKCPARAHAFEPGRPTGLTAVGLARLDCFWGTRSALDRGMVLGASSLEWSPSRRSITHLVP